MKKIRVAQIIGTVFEGGVESVIMNYFTNIDTSKVSFDFFVERSSKVIDKEKIESLGGKVVIIPHYTHFFKYIKEMTRLLKEGNYDICHSNMTTLNVFALYCAKKAGIKVRISHAHSTANKSERIRTLIKKVLRPFAGLYATDRIACGEYAGKWLFGKKDFTVMNNAVDISRFKFNETDRNKIRSSLNISENFVIGHVGRFCSEKNHAFMLEFFKQLLAVKPFAKLLLIGEGSDEDKIRSLVLSLKLEDYVIFAGSQKHPEDYYQAMDVFVLPSLSEGFPVVSVEAQANGLKCFFSNTVTTDTKFIETTEFLPLETDVWVNALASVEPTDRKAGFEELSKSEYNVQNQASKLLNRYITLLEKNK